MSLQDTLDAMRASFESKLTPEIMDGHGMIIHVSVHPDYTKRPEPADIVNLLGSIG